MTPTDEFLRRKRVLEARYRSMKYQNLHLDQLPGQPSGQPFRVPYPVQ